MSDNSSAIQLTPRKPRWYTLTPSKVLAFVLLVQVFLFLSAGSFPLWFKLPQAFAILVAVAVTAFCLLLLAAWVLVGWIFKAKRQFGLATLLLAVLAVAFPCGWLARQFDLVRQRQQLAATLGSHNAYLSYYGPSSERLIDPLGQKARKYLVSMLGEDFFTEVTHIDMVRATEADLEILQQFPRLQFLTLTESDVTDAGLEHLRNLRAMQAITLEGTTVSAAGLAHLRDMPKLRGLTLGGRDISDAHLKRVAELALTGLTLNECRITDQGIAELKQLKNLRTLRLRTVPITDVGLEEIGKWEQLTYLDLVQVQVTGEGLRKVREALPECKVYHR